MRRTYLFVSAEIILVAINVALGVELTVITVIVEHPERFPHLVVTVVFPQTHHFCYLSYCVKTGLLVSNLAR